MTEIGHECHRDDFTVCILPFSERSVVFNCACDAQRHADDSPTMLYPSKMGDVLSDLSAVMIEITGIPSFAQNSDVGGWHRSNMCVGCRHDTEKGKQ